MEETNLFPKKLLIEQVSEDSPPKETTPSSSLKLKLLDMKNKFCNFVLKSVMKSINNTAQQIGILINEKVDIQKIKQRIKNEFWSFKLNAATWLRNWKESAKSKFENLKQRIIVWWTNFKNNIWPTLSISLLWGAVFGTMFGFLSVAFVKYYLGFGKAGIVKGLWAASYQSSIGNVASGSLFAKMTSLGMTSLVPFGVICGLIIGIGITILLYVIKPKIIQI